MKTRIKVRHYADGHKTYQIQYKGLSLEEKGFYLVPILGWSVFLIEKLFWNSPRYRDMEFTKIENAQNEINLFLKEIEDKKAIELANKKVKTEYIKYP